MAISKTKVFEVPFFNRTFAETVSGILPTINGTPEFRRGEKGYGLAGFAGGDGLSYSKTIPNGTYSVVTWVNYNGSTWDILFDGRFGGGAGTGVAYIDATGLYISPGATIYVNNIISNVPIRGSQSCVIFEGMVIDATKIFINQRYSISSGLVNSNSPYIAIYEGTLTSAERDELYQDFLRAPGTTSSPITINHRIPVSGDEERRGDEIVVNSGFDTDSDWTKEVDPISGNNWTIADGKAIHTAIDITGGLINISQTLNVVIGQPYRLTMKITKTDVVTQPRFAVYVGGVLVQTYTTFVMSTGETMLLTFEVTPTASTSLLRLSSSQISGDFTVDFMSMQPVQKCVLAYDFQNWRGGIVPDLSPEGNNGTPSGCVQPTVDGARFDGSTGYIDCGTGGGITGNLTIEALVRKSDVVGDEAIINRGWSGATEINYYLGFFNDELKCIIGDGVGTQTVTTTTLNAIANEWYYVVATVDGSFIKSFSNGQLLVATAQTRVPTPSFNKLTVGCLSYVGSTLTFSYDGSIKFVKVHNYALTPEEIKNKYNKIARQVIFNAPINELPDNRSYTAGNHLENWQVYSGTFTVKEDSTGTYIECTGNGVIQYKGVNLSMHHENGFIREIVGDLSSDQNKTVTAATNVAWASNILSVTMTTGQKLYKMLIQKGEEQ